MAPVPRWRPTARLLVIDPRGHVLLLRFRNERGETSWLTPGGAIQRGETVPAAAVRELAEETGYTIAEAALGPVVATRAGLWRSVSGRDLVFAADAYFLVRVTHSEVSTDGHEEHERTLITGHRWWTIHELRATSELVVPPGLGDLLAGLLADGAQARPVRLRWR